MIRYGVRDLHAFLLWIDHMISHTYSQERYRLGDTSLLNKSEQDTVSQQIKCVRKHCAQLEAGETITACDALSTGLSSMSLGECRGHLIGIREMITDIVYKRVFMYIPLNVSKYAPPYQNPVTKLPNKIFSEWTKEESLLSTKPFGEKVFNVFVGARFDA